MRETSGETTRAVSYTHLDQLLNTIWGYEFDGASRTVDVHVRTLRQKLGEAGRCIETVRGVGYKAESDPSKSEEQP